jgi:predicted RNase H-like nuclease
MAVAGGIDGCRGGWLCVTRDAATGRFDARILSVIDDVLGLRPRADMLAVDIPIGLTERGPRLCDLEARARLGRPRGSSVFPAPIRPVLAAGTCGGRAERVLSYQEACRIGRTAEGRALSIQAWGIVPKIRQVDEFLAVDPSRQDWMREAHPELSFWRANGERPMAHNKKTTDGRKEREALLTFMFGEAIPDVRASLGTAGFAHDDLLDAFIQLWTAERILSGEATTLPEAPPRDARGLRMEIWT